MVRSIPRQVLSKNALSFFAAQTKNGSDSVMVEAERFETVYREVLVKCQIRLSASEMRTNTSYMTNTMTAKRVLSFFISLGFAAISFNATSD